jgi:hypothetical protein
MQSGFPALSRDKASQNEVQMVMRNTVLFLVLASSAFVNHGLAASSLPERSGADSPTAQVSLSTSIVFGKDHTPSLHISLRNIDATRISILTGMKTGNADYPAADFSFALSFKGERQTLFCTSCGTGFLAGAFAPSIVTLAPPNETFNFDIPLQDFLMSTEQILCKTPIEGALLTVTLIGREWSLGNSKPDISYWIGTVSSSVPLTCEHN